MGFFILSNGMPNKVASECKQTTKKCIAKFAFTSKSYNSSSHQKGQALRCNCFCDIEKNSLGELIVQHTLGIWFYPLTSLPLCLGFDSKGRCFVLHHQSEFPDRQQDKSI